MSGIHLRGPKGVRVINALNRRLRTHCDCGNELREDQSFYCSLHCRNVYSPMNNENFSTVGKVQEPETEEEIVAFYKQIEESKKHLESQEERDMIQSLTPADDNPETERQLRMAVCPNPSSWTRADEQSNRTVNSTLTRKRSKVDSNRE